MGSVKMVFDGDSAKLRSELDKVIKSEQTLVSQLQAATKESEKGQVALLKEIELRKKETLAKKESIEEGRKLTAETAKQAKEIERLKDKADRAAKSQDSLFMRGVGGAASMAAGYLSIGSAINFVTSAIDNQQRLSEKSLSVVEKIARAQRQVVMNMPGASLGAISGVDARIRAAAGRTGSDLSSFYGAVASGSAASGGNIEAAIRGAEAVSQMTRLAPEDLPVLTGATLEIAKAAGSQDYGQAAGMLLQVSGVSRQPNNADIARSLPESLVAGAGTSSNKIEGMEFGAEMYATLSNSVADVTGKQTSTAVANAVVKMRDFFKRRGNDPGTNSGRFAALQADAGLREEFLSGLGGEVVYKVPMEQLFTPGSSIAGQMASNQTAIDFAKAGAMYGATVEGVTKGTPELAAADEAAVSRAIAEEGMASPGRSRYSMASEKLSMGLDLANLSILDYGASAMARAQFETGVATGGDPYDTAAYMLEARQASVRQGGADMKVSAEEAAVVKKLDELINILREGKERSAYFQDRN